MYTASADRTIRSWDLKVETVQQCRRAEVLQNGECLSSMEGHSDWVSVVRVSGGFVFSGSWDTTARMWDAKVGHTLSCTLSAEHARSLAGLLSFSRVTKTRSSRWTLWAQRCSQDAAVVPFTGGTLRLSAGPVTAGADVARMGTSSRSSRGARAVSPRLL